MRIYKIIVYLLVITLIACETKTHKTAGANPSSVTIKEKEPTVEMDTFSPAGSQYMTAYVVIADTSADYFYLRDKMIKLNESSQIRIDTMDRTYHPAKQLIALPENHRDEMFAGDYLPRRDLAEFLSLEYLNFYQAQSREKTIALVAGIYDSEKVALEAMSRISSTTPNAFVLKSEIYIDCIH